MPRSTSSGTRFLGAWAMRVSPGMVALLLSGMMAATWASGLDIPIHVQGGDGQAAECVTSGVSGLDPHGDNFLSVRSGPDGSYRELDWLRTSELETTFETRGGWVGVVYRMKNPDCLSPVTRPIMLQRKDWISKRFLTDVAG